MKHKVFGKTDVGRVRDHNEDYFLVDQELGLYVVCDGVGGSAAGEVASETACKAAHAYLKEHEAIVAKCRETADLFHNDKAIKLVNNAVVVANQTVWEKSQTNDEYKGMACTMVLLLIVGRHAVVANIGDSRVYLFRQGRIGQLTEDHTMAVEYLRRGLISAEQAGEPKRHSMITRAIGHENLLAPDILFIELMGDDQFLLCSDGLSGYFTEEALLKTFNKTPTEQLTDVLIETAKQKGGHDNITAIIIHGEDPDDAADKEVEHKFSVLKQIPLFEDMNILEMMKLLNIVKMTKFKPGETVIKEGDTDQRLFICLRGAVDVIKGDTVIAKLGGGDFFGEMALLDKSPRSASVIATDKCRMLVMEHKALRRLMEREARLAVKLLWPMCHVLNNRLRQTSADLAWSADAGGDDDSPASALERLSG